VFVLQPAYHDKMYLPRPNPRNILIQAILLHEQLTALESGISPGEGSPQMQLYVPLFDLVLWHLPIRHL
jgi:hypothetical protein